MTLMIWTDTRMLHEGSGLELVRIYDVCASRLLLQEQMRLRIDADSLSWAIDATAHIFECE